MDKAMPSYDYERPYKSAESALKKAADESGNPILKQVTREMDPKQREKREAKCIAVRRVLDKCLEEYKEGEYTFKKAIEELKDALDYL